MAGPDDTFLSRWSRRKAEARVDVAPAAPPAAVEPAPALPAEVAAVAPAGQPLPPPPPPPPPPTLDDVAELTRSSDFARFVTPDVTSEVRNAALKKLFSDPHFNIMDGLDTYIADYGQPDPLPAGMLRKMVQSQLLGLFDDEPAAPTPATALPPDTPPHEDTDLQLQPDDAAGCPGADAGAEPDPGRQH